MGGLLREGDGKRGEGRGEVGGSEIIEDFEGSR